MKRNLKLNKKQTEHIANLVRLKLTDEELEKYSEELTKTIAFVEELDEIDTNNVPATYQTTGKKNCFSEEKVGERTLTQQQALSNAPEKEDGLFTIPALNYAK